MSISIEINDWSVLPQQAEDGSLHIWVKYGDREYVHVISIHPDGRLLHVDKEFKYALPELDAFFKEEQA